MNKLIEEKSLNEEWNLNLIYSSQSEWEEDYKSVKASINSIKTYKGKLGSSAESLYFFLEEYDYVHRISGKIFTYAHLNYDKEMNNNFFQDIYDRSISLLSDVASTTSFSKSEILMIPKEKIKSFFSNYPALTKYRHKIDEIVRLKPHTLSPEIEKLLVKTRELTNEARKTYYTLINSELSLGTVIINDKKTMLTNDNYQSLLENDEQETRKKVFESVLNSYGEFKNTFTSTYSTIIKRNNIFAKTRNYTSALEGALFFNNIPVSVYENLTKTVKSFTPILHYYLEIRKKALGLQTLNMYDMYTPLIKEVKQKISYDNAIIKIKESLKPLGSEYQEIVNSVFNNRWIDVREKKGKASGAYSAGSYETAPYILLNWQNNIKSMYILTHEIGHSIHSFYSNKYQPYTYSSYSTFVAEVASTCNELFLNHYLLNQSKTRNEKLYYLCYFIDEFISTVFRQTMLAEFEHTVHDYEANGNPLTTEFFLDTYYELNKIYYGENIKINREISLEWTSIPHFYHSFYVYQYATGFCAAASLTKDILESKQNSTSKYLNFLKAGSSNYPLEVLKEAGVDMKVETPIINAMESFKSMVMKLEKII